MDRIVGIDPGANGAFCIMTLMDDGSREIVFEPMPIIRSTVKKKTRDGKEKTKTTTQLDYHKLSDIFSVLFDTTVFIEKVSAMPKQGVVSMFNFGQQIGALRALLHSFKIPHYEVTPQGWQKIMHEGAPKGQDPKQRSLIVARRLFPDVNLVKSNHKFPDDGFVDALLLAEFGRMALASQS